MRHMAFILWWLSENGIHILYLQYFYLFKMKPFIISVCFRTFNGSVWLHYGIAVLSLNAVKRLEWICSSWSYELHMVTCTLLKIINSTLYAISISLCCRPVKFEYRKNPKISDTRIFAVITLKVVQDGIFLEQCTRKMQRDLQTV